MSSNIIPIYTPMESRDIALINELCSNAAESEILEFKKDNVDHKTIAKLCSALSNAARIQQVHTAYILWGIDNETHKVVGTQFDPTSKTVGNEVFEFWLSKQLQNNLALSLRKINHPDGTVVLLEVPAATHAPVSFQDIAYVRVGSATPKLTEHPQLFQKLLENIKPYAWETAIATQFQTPENIFRLLDYPAYFRLTEQNLPDNRIGILEKLEADHLITKDVGEHWNITNLGAILFAHDLKQFNSSLARKGMRFVAYEGNDRASTVTHRLDVQKGYANGFEHLIYYINNLLPHNEHIGSVFREARLIYPDIAIRELVANALIHQDMTITGSGPSIELFSDRLEITNPGQPLIKLERMIDFPPRSRNEALASLMRRMKFCEEQGSGLDKVIKQVELYQLPPPKFMAQESSTQVVLYSPRSFAQMSPEERVRACYQHAVIKYLCNDRMKNASLCERFGIEANNAAQASKVLNATLDQNLIKHADPEHPRAGYIPIWA